MKPLNVALKSRPVVYVTRDLERALGAQKGLKDHYIIANTTPFAKKIAKKNSNILLIKSTKLLDTHELLNQPKTKQWLKKLINSSLLVFKNTSLIERWCRQQGHTLLNPSATTANYIEEKISQIEWLGKLKKYLPPYKIVTCKDVAFSGRPFILQFNRAHTGSGTMLIESAEQLQKIQAQFPNRPVKISTFITGPLFTNNNVVWDKEVLVGNIHYQIAGLPPFTRRPFATIGNDWHLPHQLLSGKQIKHYKQLATLVGRKMAKSGWKGLFGIDTVLDEKTGKLYLLEINARQPASTTYESQLQSLALSPKSSGRQRTTFEAHLCALLELPYNGEKLIPIKDGAQVIQKRIRNKELGIKKAAKELTLKGFMTIPYTNTEEEADWLRIQTKTGIMNNHNEFNKTGQIIKKIITAP